MPKSTDEQLKAKVKEQLKGKTASKGAGDDAGSSEAAVSAAFEAVPPRRIMSRMAKKPDIAMFFRELSILIDAGYPIMRALTLLGNKSTNKHLGGTIEQIAMQVEKGSTFSKALGSFPWYFSPMIVSMVEAGESGGQIAEALNNIAADFESDDELNDKMRRALAYPVLTAGIAVLVFMLVLIFVVPTFAGVYTQHNMELPAITSMLVGLSNIVTGYWWLWIPGLALVVWFLRRRVLENFGMFDRFYLRIPVIKDILILGSMARFSSSLNVLLSNGVPILQSLDLAQGAITNVYLQDVVKRMRNNVEVGRSMVQPMAEEGIFPPILVDMLFVGEESGQVPFVLEKIVHALRIQLDRLTSQLAILLGPIMTLFVGGLVLLITLSLFIPYFSFISSLGEIH